MKKLNFFVDCHVFDGGLQGTTTYLKGLYEELIKNQSCVFYLASCDSAHLKTVFGQFENVVYLEYQSRNKFVRLIYDIPRLIRKYKIDYAHFQYIVPPIKLCKYIVTIHDVLFLDFPQYFPAGYKIKNKFLFRASAKYADVVLTVSPYSRKQIAKHFKIADITVTPNAVDPIFLETYDSESARNAVETKYDISQYWLFVSRWEPRKNHHTLLRVFVENKYYENYQLVFVGEKALPNKAYEDYYAGLNDSVKSRIKTLNKIDHASLVQLVRGARLSVYPSIAEGFGIPPLESAAAAIPTICSNTTAMSDFTFLVNCLFTPLDLSDMKAKIDHALKDNDMVKQQAYIKAHYNWKVAANAFEQAISRNQSE